MAARPTSSLVWLDAGGTKKCGQLPGEKLAAREPVGDGKGWGCDRTRF